LYDDPIVGEYEPHVVKGKAYNTAAAMMETELTAILDTRRIKTLPSFLDMFNKIQDKSLSANKLNLVQNEDTFTKQELTFLNKQNERKLHVLGNSDMILDETVHGDTYTIATAIADGIQLGNNTAVRETIIKNNDDILDPENLRQLEQLRLDKGYSITDPQLINQTIDRFDMLLNDVSNSPILSTYTSLLEYQNGEDMVSYQAFSKNYDETERKHQHLNKYLDQAGKMENLMLELDAMTAGINSMEDYVNEKDSIVNLETAAAHDQLEKRKDKISEILD